MSEQLDNHDWPTTIQHLFAHQRRVKEAINADQGAGVKLHPHIYFYGDESKEADAAYDPLVQVTLGSTPDALMSVNSISAGFIMAVPAIRYHVVSYDVVMLESQRNTIKGDSLVSVEEYMEMAHGRNPHEAFLEGDPDAVQGVLTTVCDIVHQRIYSMLMSYSDATGKIVWNYTPEQFKSDYRMGGVYSITAPATVWTADQIISHRPTVEDVIDWATFLGCGVFTSDSVTYDTHTLNERGVFTRTHEEVREEYRQIEEAIEPAPDDLSELDG